MRWSDWRGLFIENCSETFRIYSPLCSVNTFRAMFFGSFGTLVLFMRLARNEDPAPNVPAPPGTALFATGQFAVDKFVLFGPIFGLCPVEMGLQLFPPLASFTCCAPISVLIWCTRENRLFVYNWVCWLFSGLLGVCLCVFVVVVAAFQLEKWSHRIYHWLRSNKFIHVRSTYLSFWFFCGFHSFNRKLLHWNENATIKNKHLILALFIPTIESRQDQLSAFG